LNELEKLTLAEVACLESILWSAFCMQTALADGSEVAPADAMRAAGAACELRVLYLWVASEVGVRTEPGRRGKASPKLDWPAGAKGRHRMNGQAPALTG